MFAPGQTVTVRFDIPGLDLSIDESHVITGVQGDRITTRQAWPVNDFYASQRHDIKPAQIIA